MKPEIRLLLARAAQAKATKQAQLLIYGDIGAFWDENAVTAKAVVEQLNALQADQLLVQINSYGGRIDEGIAIYNAIRGFQGTVITRVDGVAASIASIIAMAGSRIEMAKGSMMMIHGAWQHAEGNSADLRSAADGLDKADQTLASIYAAKTGRTAEDELARIKAGGDRWYTAEEAVAEGYADAVFDPAPAATAAAEPVFVAALTHHLPAAGVYASALRAALNRAARTPASSAASAATQPPKETPMNWKMIAQTLGISIPDNADDAAIRDLVAQKLGLDAGADDAAIVEAMAKMIAEDATEPGEPAPNAAARSRIVAKGRAAAPYTFMARKRELDALFDVAVAHRADASELNAMRASAILSDKPVDHIRAELSARLATNSQPVTGNVMAGTDARDKRRAAATAWLMARAGQAKPGSKEHELLNGNHFRGMNLHDLARDCLEEAGQYRRGMNRGDVIMAAITHSTSDFPHIFENTLNKMLLAGYMMQKPTWSRFCKTGTLTDFRPHIRYNAGSLGDLQVRGENGEYKSLTMLDAERESITGQSRGGILNVSREMIVNDDMSVFTDAARMLGISAQRTLDKAVFALFALNSGNGPTMGDGLPLFDAAHRNIAATAAAPTVASVSALRTQMRRQLDPSGVDYLDVMLDRWLGPVELYDSVLVLNNSEFDPDSNNKLQRLNVVRKAFNDIIETPRLTGTPWYGLADPNVAPVFEVGFLDGIEAPQFAQEEAFSQHGMRWRVVHEFGVAAIGWRGIVKNAGA